MKTFDALWLELPEVAWLTSVVGAMSVMGVGLAVALVLMLEG